MIAILLAALGFWFDGSVSGIANWPTDGSDCEVAGSGIWRNTAAASFIDGELKLSPFVTAGDELTFASVVTKDAKKGEVKIETEITVSIYAELPAVDPKLKASVTSAKVGDESTAYFGLVKSAAGTGNEWRRLVGAVPAEGAKATIGFSFTTDGDELKVVYSVNGTVLTDEKEETVFAVTADSTALSKVEYCGVGKVCSLSAEAEIVPVALTIPEMENIEVDSVTVGDEEITAEASGEYLVPEDTLVTVVFSAKEGYFLNRTSMTFQVGETAEFPEIGRPLALSADDLEISEIMASNEEGLATVGGKKGLDWIEIHNKSAVDIDLGGWLMNDDPTKKISKWKAIEGELTLPAGGYKIVWAEKDYEGWTADETHVALGFSAGGEAVGLATPDGFIVDSYSFGQQLDDISYGWDSEGRLGYFEQPTPGAANVGAAKRGFTPEIAFSEPHGWKTEPISVELSCPENAEAEIYYTLDGSKPTINSTRYTVPIAVASTTVIRAAVPDAESILQRDVSATYLYAADIVNQSTNAPTGFPESQKVNGQVMIYGMQTNITQGSEETVAKLYKGFTNSIPAISFVIDPADLFDSKKGIYVNAQKDGIEWERPVAVEQIDPVRGEENEFSVFAGLRIRGGGSRGDAFPKHSFRLFFRDTYGANRLNFKLFGNEGAKEFKKLDLRADQHFPISSGGNQINEIWTRDTMRDLGDFYTRGYYVHLFINGIYWGLYVTEERVDGHYAESYNGGDSDNYDVVRTAQPNFITGVQEGEAISWTNYWKLVNSGSYKALQGLDANYERDLALPVYLNVTNLVNYVLTAHYANNSDTPATAKTGGIANNIMAFRDRVPGDADREGYFFVHHDAEFSLGFGRQPKASDDATIFGADLTTCGQFNPTRIHKLLSSNGEYKKVVADIFYRECLKEGGALTAAKAEERFLVRKAEIEDAVVCELARWGKGKVDYNSWLKACDTSLNFIRARTDYFLLQYRKYNYWYPAFDPPTVSAETYGALSVENTNTTTTVYYTIDGSDPREIGGEIATGAREWTPGSAVKLPAGSGIRVKARARTAKGIWSALEEEVFDVRKGAVLLLK